MNVILDSISIGIVLSVMIPAFLAGLFAWILCAWNDAIDRLILVVAILIGCATWSPAAEPFYSWVQVIEIDPDTWLFHAAGSGAPDSIFFWSLDQDPVVPGQLLGVVAADVDVVGPDTLWVADLLACPAAAVYATPARPVCFGPASTRFHTPEHAQTYSSFNEATWTCGVFPDSSIQDFLAPCRICGGGLSNDP